MLFLSVKVGFELVRKYLPLMLLLSFQHLRVEKQTSDACGA
jgi:hypothetical protein